MTLTVRFQFSSVFGISVDANPNSLLTVRQLCVWLGVSIAATTRRVWILNESFHFVYFSLRGFLQP